ncbi:hypothetical protein Ancab_010968 [Ancistrocladus abbreviatus]
MKNKFLFCFRHVDLDSDAVDCSADRVLSYISVADKDDMINHQKDKDKNKDPNSRLDRAPSSRRSFSGVVKAVLFETSLSKSFRERRKQRKRQHRSDGDLSDERLESNRKQLKRPHKSYCDFSDQKLKVEQKLCEIIRVTEECRIISHRNPPALNLPTSPLQEKSELVLVKKKCDGLNSRNKEGNSVSSSGRSVCLNYLLYLVVFSLWVTMFWGKLWAVLMTTVWIYVVHWRNLWERKVLGEKALKEGILQEGSTCGRAVSESIKCR